MHSAAGPLLMHAVDCLEFSFLFFPPFGAVGCYCLWIWLAIGRDVRLGRIQGTPTRHPESGTGQGKQLCSRVKSSEEGAETSGTVMAAHFPGGTAGVREMLRRSKRQQAHFSTEHAARVGKNGTRNARLLKREQCKGV